MPKDNRNEDFNYEFILRGYDATVLPSDKGDDYFYVSISEMGRPVYEDDIPMEFEFNDDLQHEDPYTYAAHAAIDFYEANKGTLGLGSGAEPPKKKSKKKAKKMFKRAFYPIDCYEDWFMSFKGTPFEEEAFQLLSELVEKDYSAFGQENEMLTMLSNQADNLRYQMNKLDLERLRKAPKSDITVVIKHSKLKKKSFWGTLEIEEFLDKFEGCELESQAIMLAKDYISTMKQISEYEEKDNYQLFDNSLEKAMEDLTYKKLEWETMGSLDLNVEMDDFTRDMVELMNEVELGEVDDSLYEQGGYMRAYKMEENDLEDRSEYDVEEFDEKEEIEEFAPDRSKFDSNDSVKLTKTFEKAMWFGEVGEEIPKGTKGVVQSCWEGTDEFYVVFFEDFGNIKVPAKILSK